MKQFQKHTIILPCNGISALCNDSLAYKIINSVFLIAIDMLASPPKFAYCDKNELLYSPTEFSKPPMLSRWGPWRQALKNAIWSGSRVTSFYSPALFLLDRPNVHALWKHARKVGQAFLYNTASNEFYAAAFRNIPDIESCEVMKYIRQLSTLEGSPETHRRIEDHPEQFVLPNACCPERSTVLSGHTLHHSAKSPEGPHRFNSFLAEILNYHKTGEELEILSDLSLLKSRSKVPWIVNDIMAEIETTLMVPSPLSTPPEIHISPSTLCNLKCSFCSYSNNDSHKERLRAEDIISFDQLALTRSLRLSSGHGEPTTNRELSSILKSVSKRWPHLKISLFTNGVLLHRNNLIDSLIDSNVQWINVSLNSSDQNSWRELCGRDLFHVVTSNLKELKKRKRLAGKVQPLVFASMVLTRTNFDDLPRIIKICRELGIDRFTAFPFASYGESDKRRMGSQEHFLPNTPQYQTVYDEVLLLAKQHRVSIEIPTPCQEKSKIHYGSIQRTFLDYALIETNERPFARLVSCIALGSHPNNKCNMLWRQANIIFSGRDNSTTKSAFHLYPCVSPLMLSDFTMATNFDIGSNDFQEAWNSSLMERLRLAQSCNPSIDICSLCHSHDLRDPDIFNEVECAIRKFENSLTTRIS